VQGTERSAEPRFEFGKNWASFLERVDAERIDRAIAALRGMLEVEDLRGRTFLDVGSGSGLSSLAARKLGARVHSFDYDARSVACTRELKRRHFPDDDAWTVEAGSALDRDFLTSLGTFDVVYSWGVLHHTGAMWQALDLVALAVAPHGQLFVAIYNDLGSQSARWRWIKRTYNRLPRLLRSPFAVVVMAPSELRSAVGAALRGSLRAERLAATAQKERGMSRWHDIVDWVGGYPYEVATPESIFDFYRARGFDLTKLRCGNVGLGCNEFVFRRSPVAASRQ